MVKIPTLVKAPPDRSKSGSRWSVRFFAHHGAGFAQSPGGKMNRLVKFMDAFQADVYACGHVHDQIARRQPIIGANAACTELIATERVGIITGSYLKTYAKGNTTYGEQRGYFPVNLGMAGVMLTPDDDGGHGEIKAEV